MSGEDKRQVRKQYNQTSNQKVKKYRDPFWRFYYRMSYGKFVQNEINAVGRSRESIRILDVGTGAGLYVYFVRGENREIIGIDISSTAVETANQELGEDASFLLGDGENLSFPDQTFDVVLGMGTAEYITDLDPLLAEFKRVLRPSGRVILSTHNANAYRSRTDKNGSVPVAAHSIADLTVSFDKHGLQLVSSRTIYTVPQIVKLGFMSDRVPDLVRGITLLTAVCLERSVESIPKISSRGDYNLVSASFNPEV